MFRSERGSRTYIMTMRRITLGEELKYRNGLAALRRRGMQFALDDQCKSVSGAFALTEPSQALALLIEALRSREKNLAI